MRKFRVALMVLVVAMTTMGFIPSHAATGEDQILVGTDDIGDGALTGDPTLAPAGLDLSAMFIHQPDFAKPEIEFIWQVTDLPPVTPNEIVRYLWTFDVSGKTYQVLVKTSDVVSATLPDDPAGQATHVQGAFRVRGNCEVLVAVFSCHHLLWVSGTFDTATKQIRITVPLDSPALPDIRPGATIDPSATGQVVQAGFQAVISNANTTDTATPSCSYTIPTGDVAPGVGDCVV